ncbi:MAG: class I SAM-dependent methyltransferase [Myxococcota bacterium]
MNARTRAQLLELNRRFYEAHAEAFDRSRGARAWPGWHRLLALLVPALRDPAASRPRLGRVLDVGCGNARLACFLDEAGVAFDYTGVDANAALLAAAQRQLPPAVAGTGRLIQQDFLAGPTPGDALPAGPFDLVVLMGVLHHVPGADWRLALLRAATARLAPAGRLALTTWQFASDPRESGRRVAFEALGPVLGAPIDVGALEPGDALLPFGADPLAPPRYCHAVADAEFEAWPRALGLACLADFRADGPRGDSNRYALMRRR